MYVIIDDIYYVFYCTKLEKKMFVPPLPHYKNKINLATLMLIFINIKMSCIKTSL